VVAKARLGVTQAAKRGEQGASGPRLPFRERIIVGQGAIVPIEEADQGRQQSGGATDCPQRVQLLRSERRGRGGRCAFVVRERGRHRLEPFSTAEIAQGREPRVERRGVPSRHLDSIRGKTQVGRTQQGNSRCSRVSGDYERDHEIEDGDVRLGCERQRIDRLVRSPADSNSWRAR